MDMRQARQQEKQRDRRTQQIPGQIGENAKQKNRGAPDEAPLRDHPDEGRINYFFSFSTLKPALSKALSLKTRSSFSVSEAFSTLPLHMLQQN